MKGHQFLLSAIALSSTVSAWPSWLPPLDSLIVRQAGTSTTNPTTTTAANTATGTVTTPTTTAKTTGTTATGKTVQTTNLNTGGQSTTKATGTNTGASGTTGGTATGSTTAAASHTTFNAQDPAGGVSMISPATTSGTQLYRIGETITWLWNYTSVQATPTGVDVLVACSTASETWTLTQNMSFAETGSFTWDTNAYKQTAVASPLLTEQYTLIIYDADSSVSATAEAGYLAVSDQFTFGLYDSRPYQNLSEWKCITCSAGNGDLDRKALGFAASMAVLTVLSFTWFVAGFGAVL